MQSFNALLSSRHTLGPLQVGIRFSLVLLGCSLALAAVGCSRSVTELKLASEVQSIPMPKFVARDVVAVGQRPKFSQIRVYELTGDCSGEGCPLMWDVSVAEEHSPTQFIYGGFPGFGSQTLVSARELMPNRRYLLVTLPTAGGDFSGRGEFRFRVSDKGEVVPD